MSPLTMCSSLCGVFCVAATASLLGGAPEASHSGGGERGGPSHATYLQLPIAFEPIEHSGGGSFRARGLGFSLRLSGHRAVLDLPVRERATRASLTLSLVGSEQRVPGEGLERLPGTVNYFLGNRPSEWKTSVPTFARVRYADVYSGVDLVFYGNQRELEYDFIIKPGADPSRIRIRFDGSRSVRLDPDGDLLIETAAGQVRQRRPVAYQRRDEGRALIPASYVVRESGEVEFVLGSYDTRRALVIDPILVYSSYLGGTGSEAGEDVAVDAAGYMYVTGATSADPGLTPFEAFVVKINPRGSAAVYTAIFGGLSDDEGRAIAVDWSGNAYVTGTTDSEDFPVVNGFQRDLGGSDITRDAFVTKLNAHGTALLYSTFLGGSMDEIGLGIAVDVSGNAYVVGALELPFPGFPPPPDDFPTVNALQPNRRGPTDGFVAKINRSGSALVYSTYLGGTSGDAATGVAVDVQGQAHVLGHTGSFDFPLAAAFQPTYGGGISDAFIAKFSSAGTALLYASYLGGGDYDQTGGVSLDAAGNALVAGVTWSTDFPVVNALQPEHAGGTADAFAAKINPDGSTVLYATYLGGSGNDVATAAAATATGSAVVAGSTESPDFPLVDAQQHLFGGNTDAFVTRLDAAGAHIVHSTFLGGDRYDSAQGVAVDASDNVYVAGPTGSFASPFPVTPDALQLIHGGGEYDAFVTKIGALCPPDETAALDLFVQPMRTIAFTPLRYQWVFVRNTTTSPVAAPLAFALTNLTNAIFVGSRLTTQCASSTSSPFQVVFAGLDRVLMPGEITATLLFFVQTAAGDIEYTPRVLRGIPVR